MHSELGNYKDSESSGEQSFITTYIKFLVEYTIRHQLVSLDPKKDFDLEPNQTEFKSKDYFNEYFQKRTFLGSSEESLTSDCIFQSFNEIFNLNKITKSDQEKLFKESQSDSTLFVGMKFLKGETYEFFNFYNQEKTADNIRKHKQDEYPWSRVKSQQLYQSRNSSELFDQFVFEFSFRNV